MQTIAQKIYRQAKREARREAKLAGKREAKLEVVKKALALGLSEDWITRITGMSSEKIQAFKNKPPKPTKK